MYIRENYLEKLRENYNTNNIKIIKGVRRVGKSTILNQIIQELRNDNVDDEHIIIINFDMFDNNIYTNTALFTLHLKNLLKDKKKYYIFIDEIQNMVDWEKIIFLFNASYNLSIFVTGSNSNLDMNVDNKYLSNYVTLQIFPYTFKEFININKSNKNKLFKDYLKWGGIPPIVNIKDEYTRKTTIIDIYNSIVVKDIVDRYSVKDVALFNKMIHYILLNLDSPFSVNNMAKYFETYDRKVSLDTMYNYLEYIGNTAMFNKIERYNINSDKILAGKYKYYVSDFSFINLIDKEQDIEKYKLENIVCNELLYREYDVKQAIIGTKEINFVAIKDNEKIYIEVLQHMDEKISKEEFKKFKSIKDNSKKYILTLDDEEYTKDGVMVKNIINFLLEEDI